MAQAFDVSLPAPSTDQGPGVVVVPTLPPVQGYTGAERESSAMMQDTWEEITDAQIEAEYQRLTESHWMLQPNPRVPPRLCFGIATICLILAVGILAVAWRLQ